MSTARPADEDAAAEAIAAGLREARFVRVCARPDGAALAASGVLARACRDHAVPFQVRVAADPASAVVTPEDDTLSLTVGTPGGGYALDGGPVPLADRAAAVAAELGVETDPVLTLAGVVAGGDDPGVASVALDRATEAGRVERRPGVGVPTTDLVDGLAHTTLAHGPFSGDAAATRDLLGDDEVNADALKHSGHRRVASLAAVAVAGAEEASRRAGDRVERLLRPYATPGGPFDTLAGYADVLDVVARERPGTGVALALGHDARTSAVDAWRAHAAAAHDLVRTAAYGRYDGFTVARVDGDGDGVGGEGTTPSPSGPSTDAVVRTGRLSTAARLVRDFRAPEPVALVLAPDGAAAAGDGDVDVGAALRTAAEAVDATALGGERTAGEVRFDDTAQSTDFVDAFGGAL